MKWTLNFERIDEAGILESRVVGHIERPELGSEVDLGLTHDDGKSLIRQIQAEVADDQVHSFISKTDPVAVATVSARSKTIGAARSIQFLAICVFMLPAMK